MSRVTAPVSKLTRSINSAAGAHPSTFHNAGAVLMPKYAELLGNRRSQDAEQSHHQHARGLATAHRPAPQPSLAGRPRPLMQTFSTTSAAAVRHDASSIDYMVFPSPDALAPPPPDALAGVRLPLLPDNFLARHAPEAADAPLAAPQINVVAADPASVLPAAALTEVEGIGIDGVELKFAHEGGAADEREPGMLTDLWKGLMDDVFGDQKAKPAH